MPTVHRAHGLCFVIYVFDHSPRHVHVIGDGDAKIAFDTPVVRVMYNRGLSKADVKRALNVVQDQRTMLAEAWKRLHG